MYARIFLALLSAGIASPVFGQPNCNHHDVVVKGLAKAFKEQRVAGGLASNGRLMEVYASLDGKTWTIVLTTPEKFACIIASGEGWRVFKPEEPEA